MVGEARLGAQLTVKGIRGIDRTGQWRFQWQRVWKQGRGQEKVETLTGAKGPHHQVTAEDCGCRLRVVSARRLPNGQVDRTILYALSSFIPPLEAMQVLLCATCCVALAPFSLPLVGAVGLVRVTLKTRHVGRVHVRLGPYYYSVF